MGVCFGRSSACPNVPSTAIGQWSRENAPSASLRERDGEPGSAGSGIAALADPATGADVATASPSPPPSPPPLSAVCVVSPRREPGEASPPPRDLGRGAVSTGTSVAGPTAAASRSPDIAPSTPTGSGDVVDIHAVTIVASSDDGGESASNRGHSPGEQAASASATSAQAAPSSMPVVGAMGVWRGSCASERAPKRPSGHRTATHRSRSLGCRDVATFHSCVDNHKRASAVLPNECACGTRCTMVLRRPR